MHGFGRDSGAARDFPFQSSAAAGSSERARGEERPAEGASRVAFAAAPPMALPGIASLFHQQRLPRGHDHQNHAPSFNTSSSSSSTTTTNQLSHQHHQQRPERHATTIYSQLVAGSYAGTALDANRQHQHRRQHHAATGSVYHHAGMRDGSSPNLDAFKSIGITSGAEHAFPTPASSQRPAVSLRRSRSSGSDTAARTHTSYKLKSAGASSGGASSASAALGMPSQHQRPVRMSRYLRESDRRNILRRIENGEKQADLAKEYQVSRAAISNLKQRRSRKDLATQHDAGDALQEQQQNRDEEAEEEKESAYQQYHSEYSRTNRASASSPSSPSSSSSSSSASPGAVASSPSVPAPDSLRSLQDAARATGSPKMAERVAQLDTLSAEILFTRLVDHRTDVQAFHIAVLRLTRLLLEHALSSFATQTVQIPLPALSVPESRPESTPFASQLQRSPSSLYAGVVTAQPACAVAVTESAAVLLREFQALEPQSATGYVSFASSLSSAAGAPAPTGSKVDRRKTLVRLPRDIRGSSVLVLGALCSRHSLQELVFAVQEVLARDVHQEDVCIVTLCCHERALAQLLAMFSRVRVVTGKVLAADDDDAGGTSDDAIALLHSRLASRQSL